MYYFSDALDYTFAQLAEMHNTSFSGYFVPAIMNAAQVSDFWRINQIDATRCVVMHDANGSFVGLARMGTRGVRGWCGGFGIAPAFRGTGASKLLAEEMVRVARASGLAQLQLEVLSQNKRAFKLYAGVGFAVRRRLFGLELATQALPVDRSSSLSIEHVPLESLLSWSQPYPEQLCWGRELASILTMDAQMFVATGTDGRQNALIGQRLNDKFRIQVALIQSSFPDDTFASFLRAVASDASIIQVYNEQEDSDLLPRYRAFGFTESFSQYEMSFDLEQ